MRYYIIIPAYNEAETIVQTLESMLNQTVLAEQIVVVNDDSIDDMVLRIERMQHPQCKRIKIVHKKNLSQSRSPGSKIIAAFNYGLSHIKEPWDLISKIDADILLPENYFEVLITHFKKDRKIGMAGGEIYFWDDDAQDYVLEGLMKRNHLRGAIKTYSRACFESMGGLKESMGWDTIDTILAQHFGFKIKVDHTLKVRSFYKTGLRYARVHAQRTGVGMYKMRYNWWIAFISCAKAAYLRKSLSYFYQSYIQGFWNAKIKQEPYTVTPEEGAIIKQYRMKGFKKYMRF